MPLVIYTGIHAISREPELHLPPGTQILTLNALTAESPAALLPSENSDESHQADESQQSLLLESLCEETLNTLSGWLKKNTDAKATIVWPKPDAYIAGELAAGKKTDDVLDEWQQLAAAVLTLFRSHRRQLMLVGAEPGGETLACLEEIAWQNGWINDERLLELAKPLAKTQYGQYLQRLVSSKR